MSEPLRTFTDAPAVRQRVPLLLGLVGPSGSGKTYSALRLATGIVREVGGEIFVIDTEARRSLHYADTFRFRHVEFKAPFGPLDYLAAIEYCVAKGATAVVVDSMSHEHEGPGGVLEMHEQEAARLAAAWKSTIDKVKFSAWIKPKAQRQRLLNSVVQMDRNFIFCFRAKEKLKLVPGKDPVALGWQAIGGEEFVYEMTMSLLLPPNCGGVPDLSPEAIGERALVKVPVQFRELLKNRRPLDEDLGADLARWAAGANPEVVALLGDLRRAIESSMPGSKPADRIRRLCELLDLPQTKAGVASATSLAPERVRQAIAGLGAPLAADPARAATAAPATLSAADVEALAAGLRATGRWSEEDLLLTAELDGVRRLADAPADALPRLREILNGWAS